MTTQEVYVELAKKSGHADSEALLRILAKSMTPEEAALLLELPAANEDLAAKLNVDEETVEKKIDELMRRGLVVPSRRGPRFPNNLAFLHEAMLSSAPEFIPTELPALWKEVYRSYWWKEIADALSGLEIPTLRVIPAQEAVPPDVDLLPWEDVKFIVRDAKSRAVRNCACRVMLRDCATSLHNCMQFNRRADYALSRGSGRKISVEDMLALCLASEEEGLVPIVANIALMDRMDYICYCCSCCCTGLEPLKKIGNFTAGYAKSRFLAEVDQEACQGCQTCLTRCHFEAIELEEVEGSKKRKASIDPNKCFGCGVCVLTCEPKALKLNLARPPEHIPSLNPTAMR